MNFDLVRKSLAKTYDDLADYWGSDKTLHDWGEGDLREFAEKVGKGASVLDLGCASGFQSKILTDLGLIATGLDLSPGMIKIAKKRVPRAKFVVGDMTKMDFVAGSFDGVYARASVLHIPKKLVPKVFKNVHKILKGGGIFYLAVKEGNFEGDVDDERHGTKVRRFFSHFRESEIKKLLESSCFKIKSISYHQRVGGTTKWIKLFAKKA